MKPHQDQLHLPVLLDAVVDLLQPKAGESYLDLTAGYGGHAAAILKQTGNTDATILVDRDEMAIKELKQRFGSSITLRHESFADATATLTQEGRQFDMILLDLGVSSPQLDRAERGFSFKSSGPLDMRMDQRQSITAATIVNQWDADQLAKLIKQYGDEPRANSIAKAIVAARPLATTDELQAVIARVMPRRGRTDPATRTFQAIRMAVNQELEQLEQTLPRLIDLLNPGGRVAIISFHSLEDRAVKRFLKDESYGYEARLQLLTRQPLSGQTDDVNNIRARSAKLRGAVKINTKTERS